MAKKSKKTKKKASPKKDFKTVQQDATELNGDGNRERGREGEDLTVVEKPTIATEEISPQALARKAAFNAAKDLAGGAEALWLQQKNKPWTVYFNEEGDIVCFTNQPDHVFNEEWITHDFTQEQLGILKGKDLTKYRVRKEESEENVYIIELKPIETVYVSAKEDFLYEVTASNARKWDLMLEVHKDDVVVKLGKAQLEKYKDVYPISATVNGQRLIKVFITAANDPHVMFHYQVIALADLLSNNGEHKFNVDIDFREYSFYTNKLFDVYVKKIM